MLSQGQCRGRAVGAVSSRVAGAISREMSRWVPAWSFAGLRCLDLAPGGENPAGIPACDAAVAGGEPIMRLWLFCPRQIVARRPAPRLWAVPSQPAGRGQG